MKVAIRTAYKNVSTMYLTGAGIAMNEIIDADEIQKKKAMPYQWAGCLIREVPMEEPENPKQKRIVEEIARIQREHGLVRR